jgi:hypothetical protein
MEDEITYPVNDTNRAIQKIMDDLAKWRTQSDRCDQRVASIMLTTLEEAQLWSLKLVTPLSWDS